MNRKRESDCKTKNCNKVKYIYGYCNKHYIKYKINKKEKTAIEKYPWHILYSRSNWLKLRQMKLSQNPLCETCKAVGVDIDHIIPHKGDLDIFYNYNNLQTLCKSCHAIKTFEDITYEKIKSVNVIVKIIVNPKKDIFKDGKELLGYDSVSDSLIKTVLKDRKINELKILRVSDLKNIERIKRIYALTKKYKPVFEVHYEEEN